MREEYGLDGTESGPIVIWAIRVLEREIRVGHLPDLEPNGPESRSQ
jgi:hypothetical protein